METEAREAQRRLREAHAARAAVGAREARHEPRRAHRARERREPMDHGRGGARRRAALARAQLRDADRHRHRACGRSAAHRARCAERWPRHASRCAWCWIRACARRPARALAGGGQVLILTGTASPDEAGAATLSARGAASRRCRRRARSISPRSLRALGELEANEVLVEAGAKLAGDAVARGLVDELLIYLAPAARSATRGAFVQLPQSRRARQAPRSRSVESQRSVRHPRQRRVEEA